MELIRGRKETPVASTVGHTAFYNPTAVNCAVDERGDCILCCRYPRYVRELSQCQLDELLGSLRGDDFMNANVEDSGN